MNGPLLMSSVGNKPVCISNKMQLCLLSSLASSVVTHSLPLGTAGLGLLLFFFQAAFNRGFTKNMKLEAVNPRNPGELCVASVVSVKGRLLWLHLEGMYSQLLFKNTWGVLSGGWGTGRFGTLINAPLVILLFKQILNYSVLLNK